MRTWAIWNCSRAMRIYCSAGIIAICGFCAYFTAEWIRHTQFMAFPSLHGCSFDPQYQQVYLAWVFFCILDLVLLVLTAIKGREHFRPGSPRLVSMLYLPRSLRVFWLHVCSHARQRPCRSVREGPSKCILFLDAALDTLQERLQCLLIGFERTLYLMLACRVVVHLRAAASRPWPCVQD